MNPTLLDLLERHDGVLRRRDVLACVDHDVLDQALESGRLVRVLPETYVAGGRAADRSRATGPALTTVAGAGLTVAAGPGLAVAAGAGLAVAAGPGLTVAAAMAYAEGRAALSHLTALALWRLPVPPGGPLHLITDGKRHLRGAPGLVVHRRDGLELRPPDVVNRGGRPVTRLERSIVDSWPLLDGDAKRAPAIFAVAQRMTTPGRLAEALADAPRLAGRHLFRELVRLLAEGCRSSLEIWGYDHVFRGPGFAGLRRQVPVRIGQRTVYLDTLDDETRVNFELDGAKYHAGAGERERDLRRDAALAAQGVTVVRYTHDRLMREPEVVAREALAILRSRGGRA